MSLQSSFLPCFPSWQVNTVLMTAHSHWQGLYEPSAGIKGVWLRPSHFTAIIMLYSLQVLRVFELSIYRINKAAHLPQTNQSRPGDLKSLGSRHIRSVNRFWGFVMEQKTRTDFKGCAGYLPQRSTATEARISERASTRCAAATCHTQHSNNKVMWHGH